MIDPVLSLAIVVGAALLGGAASVRLKQPAALGELLAGVVLGNLQLVGVHALEPLRESTFLDALAQVGVILLLFEVGFPSTVAEMRKLGLRSLAVALLGVIASVALGWLAAALLLPQQPRLVHAFLGGAIASSSIGVAARVFGELGAIESPEARLVLGAAIADDVLGLVLLAVLSGLLTSQGSITRTTVIVAGKAALFLTATLTVGPPLTRRLFKLIARLRHPAIVVGSALVFCFGIAVVAREVGLAAIVGAYAAGLVLERAHLEPFGNVRPLEEQIEPLTAFLGPVFFAVMGMRTNLAALASSRALLIGGALIVAALVGKAACSLAVGRGADRVAVAVALFARGEVTLVFANVGLSVRALDEATFAALMLVVLVTILVTPPLLAWRLRPDISRR